MGNSRTVKFLQDILTQESHRNEFGNNFKHPLYTGEEELKRDIRNAIKKLRTFRQRKQLEKEFTQDMANARELINNLITVIPDPHDINTYMK